MQAYCVRCRRKTEIKNPKSITLKNARPATQGTCPVCGSKVFRIGKEPPPEGPEFKIPKRHRFER